jgi:hypothetical protein
MGNSRRRPAGNRNSNRSSNQGPGRTGPTTDTGYVEVPIGQPTAVMRSWAANQDGRMEPAGPWETAAAVRLDGHPADGEPAHLQEARQVLDQMPAHERGLVEQLAAQRGVDPLQMVADATVQMDLDQAFGVPEEPGPDPDPDGAGGWDSGEPTRAAGSTGSSPLGAESPLQTRAKAKAFAQLAAAAVAVVSGLLNARFRLDDEDGTWLADGEDLKAMGDPAGRIIARHAPLPGGTDASDLTDGIGIAIGAAGYLIKNARARAAALRARRRAAPAEA